MADKAKLFRASVIAAAFGLAVLLASIADNYVDPLLVWGGTSCTTQYGIHACTGYVPAGFIVSVLAAALVVSPILSIGPQPNNAEVSE